MARPKCDLESCVHMPSQRWPGRSRTALLPVLSIMTCPKPLCSVDLENAAKAIMACFGRDLSNADQGQRQEESFAESLRRSRMFAVRIMHREEHAAASAPG